MERPEDLRALARRCRELAAGITDEQTRKSLELLARDYEAEADRAQEEGAAPGPDMPSPE